MDWNLPLSVEICQKEYKIRNDCDYRVVLDAIVALQDAELDIQDRVKCALIIFYEQLCGCDDFEVATREMFRIINNGESEEEQDKSAHPSVVSWEHDFKLIAPAVSRVLGYDVRDERRYTHWYTFMGAYMEIGECAFSTIISIRMKKSRGKKLEKWEEEFYRGHKKMVDLPAKLTAHEQELLNSKW